MSTAVVSGGAVDFREVALSEQVCEVKRVARDTLGYRFFVLHDGLYIVIVIRWTAYIINGGTIK